MSRRLTFDFQPRKFIQATAYLVQRCPTVTRAKLASLLYFADKEHLVTYGRPILGDRYIKMECGPVPSRGDDLLKGNDRAPAEDRRLLGDYLGVEANILSLRSSPTLDCLSDSDIEILDEVIERHGQKTARQLSDLVRRESAWIRTAMHSEMDYRLLFVGESEAEGLCALAQEDQELRDALLDIDLEEMRACS